MYNHAKEDSMSSSTYKDIIDDKVAEWLKNLKKLEEHAEKASSDTRAAKLAGLKARIEEAAVRMHALDAQENPKNTMETKDKILQIFDAIDKDFPRYDDLTPYML
jgi:methyltransferase-like protein